jgi:hypothetical protein
LEPLLAEIESLSERISEYNDRIEALAHHSYPQVALLKQIKGVGTLIALTFLLTLEGAQYILGPFGVDCDLRRWGLKLAERGGKSGKKRAIIATARKLAVFAASPLGERRSLRTVAQEHANDSGSRVRQNATKSKPFQEEESKKNPKPSSDDCVNRLAQVHYSKSRTMGRQTDGITGCNENAQSAPSEQNRSSRVRMEAWRQWPLGGRKKPCLTKKQKNRLDSDRPSHGGHSLTQRPLHCAAFGNMPT